MKARSLDYIGLILVSSEVFYLTSHADMLENISVGDISRLGIENYAP